MVTSTKCRWELGTEPGCCKARSAPCLPAAPGTSLETTAFPSTRMGTMETLSDDLRHTDLTAADVILQLLGLGYF